MNSTFFLLFSSPAKFLYASFVLFATAFSMDLVLFPALLQEQNIRASTISYAFVFETIGIITASLSFYYVVVRLKPWRTFTLAIIIYALVVLLIYFTVNNLLIWFSFTFILGCCWVIIAVSRFAWLNTFLNQQNRGLGVAFFSTAISLGLAFGPILVKCLGAINYVAFALSSSLVLLAMLVLLPIKNHISSNLNNFDVADKITLQSFWQKNKQCFLARFFLDFQTYTLMTCTVIFGKSINLSAENAGLLITAYMTSTIFDVVAGFLLKKYQEKDLIKIGFTICCCCFIAILLLVFFKYHSYFLLLLLYFLYGSGIAFIFVSVFAMMSNCYQQQEMQAGATFQLIGTLGAFFGILLTSFLMIFSATFGFMFSIILASICYFLFAKQK
jgi:MFS family permease